MDTGSPVNSILAPFLPATPPRRAGLAAAAWLVHRGWGTIAAIYALAVMWSRIALECHHLSDVLASTVLGITMAVRLKPVLLTSVEFQFGNIDRSFRKK